MHGVSALQPRRFKNCPWIHGSDKSFNSASPSFMHYKHVEALFARGSSCFAAGLLHVEASFFGLVVAGYGYHGAVLQTEQYSGGGAVLQQYSGVGL